MVNDAIISAKATTSLIMDISNNIKFDAPLLNIVDFIYNIDADAYANSEAASCIDNYLAAYTDRYKLRHISMGRQDSKEQLKELDNKLSKIMTAAACSLVEYIESE